MTPVTESEISSIIGGIKTSKTNINTCPDMILKQIQVNITPVLAKIFNLSFQRGIFPDCLKGSCITPIFKQGNRSYIYQIIVLFQSYPFIVKS